DCQEPGELTTQFESRGSHLPDDCRRAPRPRLPSWLRVFVSSWEPFYVSIISKRARGPSMLDQDCRWPPRRHVDPKTQLRASGFRGFVADPSVPIHRRPCTSLGLTGRIPAPRFLVRRERMYAAVAEFQP